MANRQWEQWETIFLDSKISADGDCSHEINRRMLLGRKAMTNLHSILKSRGITLPTEVHLVWIWELDYKESWALKNWCFWTVVLEKTLESPWIASRLNQSIVKNINTEYALEGLKLKHQYFGLLLQRGNTSQSFPWKRLWCGKHWRQKEKEAAKERMRWLDSITDSVDMNLSNR